MSVATMEARAGAAPQQEELAASPRGDARGRRRTKATDAYVPVPLEVVWNADLSDGAFRTYCILKRYLFGRRDHCWPSIVTLAAERGCSDETIRRHVAELAKAGLVRVEKKGRHNVYWFEGDGEGRNQDEGARPAGARPKAERRGGRPAATTGPSATPSVAGHTPRSAQDDGASGVGDADKARRGINPRPTEEPGPRRGVNPRPTASADPAPDRGARVHSNEGQGFKKEGNTTTAVVVAHTETEETLATLVANGVAASAAQRLVETHGARVCRQALELLDWERSRGARIRNAGGWLYAAITQGFVRPPEDAPSLPSLAPTVSAEELAKDDHAHVAQLQDRRRDALRRRGIPEHADILWQRIQARLAEAGQGSRLLAAAYLRPVDDETWRLEGAAGGLADRLVEILPAVEEALRTEVGDGTKLALQT